MHYCATSSTAAQSAEYFLSSHRPAPLPCSTPAPPPADVDEQSKNEIKDILLTYDRTLLVADPRRCEPKK
jgi:hypothetical protein